jgi:hypothetical protein
MGWLVLTGHDVGETTILVSKQDLMQAINVSFWASKIL